MEIAGFGKVCDYDIALVYLFKHFVASSTRESCKHTKTQYERYTAGD